MNERTARAKARRGAGPIRFSTRLYLVLLGTALASIAAAGLPAILAMERLNREVSLASLSMTAAALANAADLASPDAFCKAAARGTPLRLTLVSADGAVLGDSRSDPASMDNHALRPEIARALAGHAGTSIRRSPTLGMAMAYAAAPAMREGAITAVLRAAVDLLDISARMRPFLALSMAAAAILAGLAAMASARLGSWLSIPVTGLVAAARSWSEGSLDARAPASGLPELAELSLALNAMAGELTARVESSGRLGRELGAVLDAMGEGLLALDPDLRVTMANPRAAAVLGKSVPLRGLGLLEATGSHDLYGLASRCASASRREEAELRVFAPDMRILGVIAEPLAWPDGRTGAVLVLNDRTRVKRLELVRKEFVANVSHELRTPITLIKGFLEAIEGAEPEDARRFVAIMRRHADRMQAIVDDLLTLAGLENPDRPPLALGPVDALAVMKKAADSVSMDCAAKRARVEISSEPGLCVRASEGLIEQAVVNLLQNAIRYGPAGATVGLGAARRSDGRVGIRVSDRGPGIPERDQSRIFERFYRVDRARGREAGGTGLGLAIVRHIALACGGDVLLRSREGEGSVFTLLLDAYGPGGSSDQQAEPDASTETLRE